MPLIKTKPPPRPTGESSVPEPVEQNPGPARRRERQRSRYQGLALGTTTVVQDGAGDQNGDTTAASSGSRFARPDYLLQGLLARAKQRVRDRGGRGNLSVSVRHDDVVGGVEADGVSHELFPFIPIC